MSSNHESLRTLVAEFVVLPAPTPDQVDSARRALADVMADETPTRRPAVTRLTAAAATFALALVVIVALVVPWGRTPADALLTELAFATREISPLELPEGEYVYVASAELVLADAAANTGDDFEYVQFLLPTSRHAWWLETTAQVETTVGKPIFFNAQDETFYYDNGLDVADFVGETRTQVFADIENLPNLGEWSTDPSALADQMRAEAEGSEDGVEVRMVEIAQQLLSPHLLASPDLRAAILEVLASLDGDQELLSNGHIVASYTYESVGRGTVSKQLTFDQQGYLLSSEITTLTGDESGLLAPGTVFDRVEWTPPVAVAEPGVRTAD